MIIVSEPKNKAYKDLINLAFDLCDKFILVVRKDMEINDNAKYILEKLKAYLKEMKEQSVWAGNILFESTAYVYHYRTDPQAREIITGVSDSLYTWLHPDYPEDLSFYKNGKPWLINISHEKNSYIITDNKTEIDIISSIKGLEVMESNHRFDEPGYNE